MPRTFGLILLLATTLIARLFADDKGYEVAWWKPPEASRSFTANLTLDVLIGLITEKKIKSVEALLEELAKRDGLTDIKTEHDFETLKNHKDLQESMFLNPVFVGISGGRHQASVESPRVIVGNKSKTLMMAFSTDEHDPLYGALEIAQSPDDSKVHGGVEIIFPKDGRGEVDIRLPKKGSVASTKECLECHRVGSGPPKEFLKKWEEYRLWPGMLEGANEVTNKDTSQIDKKIRGALNRRKNQGRLKHFFVLGELQNADLTLTTRSLFYQNYRRIERELSADKAYPFFKFAILGALLDCNLDSFYPDEIKRRGKSESESIKTTGDALEASYRAKVSLRWNFDTFQEGHLDLKRKTTPLLGKMRNVIEEKMGHSMATWSLAEEPGTMEFDGGYLTDFFLLAQLMRDTGIQSTVPVKWGESIQIDDGDKKICTELAKKSFSSLMKYLDSAKAKPHSEKVDKQRHY